MRTIASNSGFCFCPCCLLCESPDRQSRQRCNYLCKSFAIITQLAEDPPYTFAKTTPVGFEPTRGDPIGLAGRRLNRSAKVSLAVEISSTHHGCCCALRESIILSSRPDMPSEELGSWPPHARRELCFTVVAWCDNDPSAAEIALCELATNRKKHPPWGSNPRPQG